MNCLSIFIRSSKILIKSKIYLGLFFLFVKKRFNILKVVGLFEDLDERFIDMIYRTNIVNIDNIIEQIDNNNAKIENNVNSDVKDKSNFMLREIFNFSNISSKNFDESKAFSSVWR